MKVYLAGPIMGRSDAECNDWRSEAKRLLAPIETLDPMDRDYRGQEAMNYVAIVEGDQADIDRCDAILAYCDTPSVGTSMEIMYAWGRGVPIYIIVPNGERISPWLLYHGLTVTTTLTEAIGVIKGCE